MTMISHSYETNKLFLEKTEDFLVGFWSKSNRVLYWYIQKTVWGYFKGNVVKYFLIPPFSINFIKNCEFISEINIYHGIENHFILLLEILIISSVYILYFDQVSWYLCGYAVWLCWTTELFLTIYVVHH